MAGAALREGNGSGHREPPPCPLSCPLLALVRQSRWHAAGREWARDLLPKRIYDLLPTYVDLPPPRDEQGGGSTSARKGGDEG